MRNPPGAMHRQPIEINPAIAHASSGQTHRSHNALIDRKFWRRVAAPFVSVEPGERRRWPEQLYHIAMNAVLRLVRRDRARIAADLVKPGGNGARADGQALAGKPQRRRMPRCAHQGAVNEQNVCAGGMHRGGLVRTVAILTRLEGMASLSGQSLIALRVPLGFFNMSQSGFWKTGRSR